MGRPEGHDLGRGVDAIDRAFERHWRLFGLYPGARLCDEYGVLWFESPIAHLPYNAVIRTRITDGADVDAVVEKVTGGFRAREVPFMWVLRPTDTPDDLAAKLVLAGLDLVETVQGMDFDLAAWAPGPDPGISKVVDVDAAGAAERGLHDYEELIRTYWSVPEEQRSMITTLNRHYVGHRNPGFRLVAYVDNQPVGKVFCNMSAAPAYAAIFGLAVRPEARGRGVANQLMQTAMARAKDSGVRRMVLHSSAMARSMYLRMGYVERCELRVHATGPIFGTHHH